MGSKRWMLQNGLGHLLKENCDKHSRFIDLFAGTGAVAIYVGSQFRIPCYTYDIQTFSAVLCSAVLGRTFSLNAFSIWETWEKRAKKSFHSEEFRLPSKKKLFSQTYVHACREWCSNLKGNTITQSYGGYYFSPEQALWLDALRKNLPDNDYDRESALAALIQAASQCAASPGHTAQPFQPTKRAKPFIEEAWRKDVLERTNKALNTICNQHALKRGLAAVLDANEAAKNLRKGDLVFIDPPYSGVQYSRFYHVLETIARGHCTIVSGRGRYPSKEERPLSQYSLCSKSANALDVLLSRIAEKHATVILTFPCHECSNGLSGKVVKKIARKYFALEQTIIESKFSTLGGTNRLSTTNNLRAARCNATELLMIMRP